MAPPELHPLSSGNDAPRCDALLLLAAPSLRDSLEALGLPTHFARALRAHFAADASAERPGRAPLLIAVGEPQGGRLVYATTARLDDDVEDVRAVADVALALVSRAIEAGAQHPLLVLDPRLEQRFDNALAVAAAAALGAGWIALEAREHLNRDAAYASLTVRGLSEPAAQRLRAQEAGRWLARDITGTEPERMAPLRTAELCEKAFAGTRVRVEVERAVERWPLLAAVARASQQVERHRPCVVRLEYVPEGPVTRTLFLVGKGVTYDTGGADVKTNGGMAGMSRDKGGAGAVAGFVRAIAALSPPGLRVVGLLGMVRNSIGEDSFVSDEVIASHAGVRVRIGNTDAEGRLVMADLLSQLREEAAAAPEPVLFTVATLTGHVHRAFGACTGALANGPAREKSVVRGLAAAGERWAEPMESTRPRREDYLFMASRSAAEDTVSSNRLASVDTARGHQGPFAFLDIASGMRGRSVPYVHLDIAGVALQPADWQFGRPTGAPLATLLEWALGAA